MIDFNKVTIAVIILTYNQCERTLACLDSLLNIKTPTFHTLVWDNGSSDGTAVAIQQKFPHVVVHTHSANLGVASGRNSAARLATETWQPTHLLFLDNDMRLEPNFVNGLLQLFLNDPTVGQTQAKLRFMDDPERINDGGGSRINFVLGQTIPVGYNEIDRGQHDSIKSCISCGGAMMVRRDVFEELNGFDAIFDPFGPEDSDFSLRLQRAGYKALYAPQAVAYHVVSHTYGKGYTEDYARHKSRHWFVFLRRHATPWQKIGFYTIGLPLMGLRIVFRETRRGNIGAIRGLFAGTLDLLKSRAPTPKQE
jgi:GT2 family glycosyltransferase